MKYRRIYYLITVILIVLSIGVGLFRGYNWGIDFTGGTLIQIEMGKQVKISDVDAVLSEKDIAGSVTYAGDNNTQIIIKTNSSMNSDDRTALVDALGEKFDIQEDDVLSVENIGPSVGDTLRKSAYKAIAVAVIGMLIYIAVRFRWNYGVTAILALANTLLLLFGFYGLFHITINSPFIAAMLTILGYGINDTIVIFDRIRENVGKSTKRSINGMEPLIDKSIGQTVGRSIMTSLTTIAVMIPLLIICGSTIRSFILPLLVGVICSTLSSIFIATSLFYDLALLTNRGSYKGGKKDKKKLAESPKAEADDASGDGTQKAKASGAKAKTAKKTPEYTQDLKKKYKDLHKEKVAAAEKAAAEAKALEEAERLAKKEARLKAEKEAAAAVAIAEVRKAMAADEEKDVAQKAEAVLQSREQKIDDVLTDVAETAAAETDAGVISESTAADAEHGIEAAADLTEKAGRSVEEAVTEAAEKAEPAEKAATEAAEKAVEETAAKAEDAVTEAAETVEQIHDAVSETADHAEQAVDAAVAEAAEKVEDVREAVTEKAEDSKTEADAE